MNGVMMFFILFSLFSAQSNAQNFFGICDSYSKGENATDALQKHLSIRYPKLAFVFGDPERFFLTMRQRFEAEKSIHPHHPNGFDYSDVGLPLLQEMKPNLNRKIQYLEEKIRIEKNRKLGAFAPRSNETLIPDLETGLEYLKELSAELEKHLTLNRISYYNTIRFSYYYSRAIGYFDPNEYSWSQRFYLEIDRYIDGFHPRSIKQEWGLYRDGKFLLFQEKSKIKNGFALSEELFENAFADQKEFNFALVVTNVALDRDALMGLMRHKIGLTGWTYDPIMADGFLRPGGDFFVHDPRHESAKYFHKIQYMKRHQLTEKEFDLMGPTLDRWYLELNHETAQVRDPNLKEAIDFLSFNVHHDRGYAMIPSKFLEKKKDLVAFGLYSIMAISGQGVAFGNAFRNLPRAREWLNTFWKNRLNEEIELLKKIKGH
jgi:hypothetical protein